MNKNKETKKVKLLSPKIDVIFQALFGEEGSERITKGFLKTILKEDITEINLSRNQILRREKQKDKLGILDLIVKINGKENCDVEMQVVEQKEIIDRILFYWSKLYVKSIKKGEDYSKLEKAIVILITDKRIKDLSELKYHTEWKIIETEDRQKILTDKLELHIIELDKIEESEDNKNDELIDWLIFLKNPESERVKEKMKENENLKEAEEKLEKISEDERMQQLAWWKEKAIYDENTNRRVTYREGMEEGMKEGIKEGVQKEKIEIVKKMLSKSMPIKTIIELTGLSEEEINTIKEQIKK